MKPRPPESELLERIILLVIDHAGVEESEVRPSSRLIEDLGIDSLDFIELLMAIEVEFGIRFPETDEVNDPVYSSVFTRAEFSVSDLVSLVSMPTRFGRMERTGKPTLKLPPFSPGPTSSSMRPAEKSFGIFPGAMKLRRHRIVRWTGSSMEEITLSMNCLSLRFTQNLASVPLASGTWPVMSGTGAGTGWMMEKKLSGWKREAVGWDPQIWPVVISGGEEFRSRKVDTLGSAVFPRFRSLRKPHSPQ